MNEKEIQALVSGIAKTHFVETDKKLAALTEAQERNEAKGAAQAAELRAESAARSAETEKKVTELAESIKKLTEQVGKLHRSTIQHRSCIDNTSNENEEEEYVRQAINENEEYVRQAIRDNGNRIGNLVFDELQDNTRRTGIETDGLLINGSHVGILEIKSTLHANDIPGIAEKIPRFRRHFREYRNHQLVVIVAGKVVHNDALRSAYQHGFVVLTPDGQSVRVDDTHARTF